MVMRIVLWYNNMVTGIPLMDGSPVTLYRRYDYGKTKV